MNELSDKLAVESGPSVAVVDARRAQEYAEATNDPNPAYASGSLAPPVFGVVLTWDLMRNSGDVIPPEARRMIVHGEQDMYFHQPLRPGMSLTSYGSLFAIRPAKNGTRLVFRIRSTDDRNSPILEQYSTIFVRGWTNIAPAGPDKPDHTLPQETRGRLIKEHSQQVDKDQTFRYRDASGDDMPIHVDDAFAKRVGLPGIIVHGLCTMAMTSQSIITTVGDSDPARLRRLAVRFADNVFPGDQITTRIFEMDGREGSRDYGFEAVCGGRSVITNGRAEISA